MHDTDFTVKTAEFEGPLDLLLHLIEKRRLFINDIALAAIADEYIAYVQKAQEFSMRRVAHFILVASTLVLIKSRSLLPELQLTAEEQADIMNLEARLKVFQELKLASGAIRERFAAKMIFFRTPALADHIVFVSHASITSARIRIAAETLLANLPKVERIPKAIVQKVISLEEMIANLTTRIQSSIKMRFKEFAGVGKRERAEIVVSFLAMLELVKQGLISVRQDAHGDDIEMENARPATPNYAS